MIKWFKQKIVSSVVAKFARRLAYQPSAKVRALIESLANLSSLCQQQMQDGDWDPEEKEVFITSVATEMLTLVEGGL